MKVERVEKILALQLHRVRNTVENTDWQNLPRFEGSFDLLARTSRQAMWYLNLSLESKKMHDEDFL